MKKLEFVEMNEDVFPNTVGRPALATLCSLLESETDCDRPIETFKSAFDALQSSTECVNFFNEEIEKLTHDVTCRAVVLGGSTCVIFRNAKYTLSLYTVSRPLAQNSSVSTILSDSLLGTQGRNGLCEYVHYNLPDTVDISVFDPDARLAESSRGAFKPHGASIVLHATDLITITATQAVSFLALSERRVVPYCWTYDKHTLKPQLIEATVSSISRLRVAIDLAENLYGEYGAKEDWSEILESLTYSPYHFIRWRAVQALFRLERDAGLKALVRASRDSHRHVAEAAASSLARLAQ